MRALTEAFVRASDGGLLLPRLIPVGDPELDERIGGALDRIDDDGTPVPAAIEPLERLLRLGSTIKGEGSANAVRLATDLARALDALLIEKVDPTQLREAIAESDEVAGHWRKSLEKLQLIYEVSRPPLRRSRSWSRASPVCPREWWWFPACGSRI